LEAAALEAQIPPVPSLADIGSGAGFPGLPIAVLRPECVVTLVEAREKRHYFQRAVVRELGIAQALAPPARALPWLLPWVADGGLVLFPGSAIPPEVPERADVSFQATIRYRVPCGGPDRTLWIGRRRSG
jgi:16S rRNA G527 N7-methylase RsmG